MSCCQSHYRHALRRHRKMAGLTEVLCYGTAVLVEPETRGAQS